MVGWGGRRTHSLRTAGCWCGIRMEARISSDSLFLRFFPLPPLDAGGSAEPASEGDALISSAFFWYISFSSAVRPFHAVATYWERSPKVAFGFLSL